MMRSLSVNITVPRVVALLCAVFLLHGCFPYTSSYIADPTSRKTTKGIDPAADVTRQSVIILDSAPSTEDPAAPLTVRAVERVSGPEAVTTTVNEYKYKRYWSPLLIPLGAFQLVVTPFICLGAGLDQNPNSQALDKLFAGMNERGCETKGFARMGTYFIVGVSPTCEVRASTATKEKKLTGRAVSEDRPYQNARFRMTAYPRFAPAAPAPPKSNEGLSRDVDLDGSGRGEINVAALFREFPRAPREVEIALAFEGSKEPPTQFVINESLSEALYRPVQEEKAAEQAEREGKKADALEHYGKAYASLADRSREQSLWKKITALYRSLPTKPSPSDDARRLMIRGQAAVEMAKSAGDFDGAIREFQRAAAKAPFWPDAYYNLGMVQGKADRYDDAVQNLQKYLDLAPTASDAEEVKTLIYQFEYKKEKSGK
jgi:tetratricopeptide (TPR) repeat protein